MQKEEEKMVATAAAEEEGRGEERRVEESGFGADWTFRALATRGGIYLVESRV